MISEKDIDLTRLILGRLRHGGNLKTVSDAQDKCLEEEIADMVAAHRTLGIPEELSPVEGDLLPPIGSKVFIHLARQDEWVEHTVVGYYVWGSPSSVSSAYSRVFVRVVDRDGFLNARILMDVKIAL